MCNMYQNSMLKSSVQLRFSKPMFTFLRGGGGENVIRIGGGRLGRQMLQIGDPAAIF